MIQSRRVSRLLLAVSLLVPGSLLAEEGGSGHYFPGSMASFMDGVSPVETFITRLNIIDYSGNFGANREVPIAGQTVLSVDVDSRAYGLTLFWRPSWGGLSEKWSYAMSATVPWVDLTVAGNVNVITPGGPATVRRSDNESGLGDILFFPAMFNYHHSDDLNVNFRVGVYAPTGSYEVGRLANTGKNFWTIEPTAALVYFGQKNGREATLFFGMDFNQENSDTNYKSGTQAHLEGTLAQHFPLWSGMAGAGLTGFWYQQLTGDSGSGATLGDFKGRANGVGPVVSFIKALGKPGQNLITELKWLHEFSNKNRPEGDTIFIKIMLNF